jgi:hypothetical protein
MVPPRYILGTQQLFGARSGEYKDWLGILK